MGLSRGDHAILDGVRTIEDVLEFAKFTDCSGILLAIDFEKAFDSLNQPEEIEEN